MAPPGGMILIRTPPNEDTSAAPGFTREGRLERRNRVAPRRLAIRKVERQGSKDSLPSHDSDSSAPSTPAPATPKDRSSPIGFGGNLEGGMVEESQLRCSDDLESMIDDVMSLYSSSEDGIPGPTGYSPTDDNGDVYTML